MKKKTKKLILITILAIIIVFVILLSFGLKLVRINHATYFTKEFYHYTIFIEELDIEYFKNVNPNEISHVRVVASNETNNIEYFFTFEDSIELIVITDGLDSNRIVQLNYFTNIFINPSYQTVFIHSDSDDNKKVFD